MNFVNFDKHFSNPCSDLRTGKIKNSEKYNVSLKNAFYFKTTEVLILI